MAYVSLLNPLITEDTDEAQILTKKIFYSRHYVAGLTDSSDDFECLTYTDVLNENTASVTFNVIDYNTSYPNRLIKANKVYVWLNITLETPSNANQVGRFYIFNTSLTTSEIRTYSSNPSNLVQTAVQFGSRRTGAISNYLDVNVIRSPNSYPDITYRWYQNLIGRSGASTKFYCYSYRSFEAFTISIDWGTSTFVNVPSSCFSGPSS
jgi:hypothetical protein